ncbi:MAG: hypothetical protein HWD61_13695 [Parachlamydiaceae bacterium]|nr:MAG: hypothetical protein HWD61_13695 [Parachlamydiaceae bacterium]
MSFKNTFPSTYHTLNPFTREFGHAIVEHESGKDITKFKSCDGRSICLLKLILSPVSIPMKLARKIFRLVTAVFQLLAEVFHVKVNDNLQGYFSRLGYSSIRVLDRIGSLVLSPINITVSRIRYILGLIHPGLAFHKKPQLI